MLSIIVAIGKRREIGLDGKLIWRIPDDLKHFKSITMNKTIIMGRKTFESLPDVLPGRHHIVLTNNKFYSFNSPHVEVHTNLLKSIDKFKDSKDETFVIGGAEIYRETISFCKKLYITYIEQTFDADTYFPEFNTNAYSVKSSPTFTDENCGLSYRYLEYSKI